MEEFWRQAELEKERGLPLTVPQRDATDLANFQQGFIAFIRPLFAAADRIGGVDMSLPMERLDDTARRWQSGSSRAEAYDPPVATEPPPVSFQTLTEPVALGDDDVRE